MIAVHPEKIRELVTDIFIREKVPPEDAAIVVDALLDANLTGRASHGILRTKSYIHRIEAGGINPRADIRVIRESDTTAVIDGDNGLGMVISTKAARLCRDKAEKTGIACVAVRNSNHYGAAAYWTEMIGQDDMIAFSCSNSEPLVAPPGGKAVALGTNPLCMYVPTASHGPLCLDIATSAVAQGKLFDYRLRHHELGVGWAVDAEGLPTTDPERAVYLTPFAAHKGYGIAVMIEVMCSLLTGGVFGPEIHSLINEPDKPNNVSYCFIGINISRFRDLAAFKEDVDRFVDFLHATPAVEGQRVLVPGELEQEARRKVQEEGLLLPEDLVAQLKEIAADLGIENAEQYFSL